MPPPSVSSLPLRRVLLELTPLEVAARARHLPGCVFFDSALETGDPGQISIVAANPTEVHRGRGESDFGRLQAALSQRECEAPDSGMPVGFAAGWIEYDGAFCFGIYENALIYRHADEAWFEVGDMASELASEAESIEMPEMEFASGIGEEQFCRMVDRAQQYIAAGDIYQVNLSHRFAAPFSGDAFAFHVALRDASPAPFAAYLDLCGRQVMSTSPECFLTLSGRSIRTHPIKGTRPRRFDPTADEKSAYDLITSPKEVAELIMITDLERNDLGQVCEFGSVRVPELLKLERFAQVFHLVSTVEGRLRSEITHLAALRACFPGGSITGAPKKRAREIIAELEPEPRGLYTGAIGWLGFNGESRFNIAIRTVIAEAGEAHFHVGAGIVADSIPEKEWQETLDKAAGILLAAGSSHSKRR